MPSFLPQGPPSDDTDAYRVAESGEVSIDSYAGHWVVQTRGDELPEGVDRYGVLGARSVWWKRLDQHQKEAPRHLSGEKISGPFLVREHGVNYEVDLEAGYSQGIFLDQRLNRLAVGNRVEPGVRVLNAFAYTCGFSVVAALQGAETTSLDLSRPYLEWGKRNFRVNDLDAEAHFFTRGDVFDWLGRWKKSGVRFDGIVLDPPTFSRGGGRGVFRVETDYADLVAGALEVLLPGGWMLCCTNFRGMNAREFEEVVKQGTRGRGKREQRPMPPEYVGEQYLKTVWVEMG